MFLYECFALQSFKIRRIYLPSEIHSGLLLKSDAIEKIVEGSHSPAAPIQATPIPTALHGNVMFSVYTLLSEPL